MGLVTTTAGWFPRSAALVRARWQFAEGELDEAALRAAERTARREAVGLQQRLGIARPVDGQLERADPIGDAAERIEGFEPAGLVRCFGNRYFRKPRLVGEVAPGPAAPIAAGWQAASSQAASPVRAVVTGPYSLMDGAFDEHYRSREACCMALAQVVAAQVGALLEAGAQSIQLDEPLLGGRPHEMSLAGEALAEAVRPAAGRAEVWLQTAHGWLEPIAGDLPGLPVDVLLLELSHASPAVLQRLGELPDGKLLGAGVVDVIDPAVEDEATIRGRLERVLEHLPADRVIAAPDGPLRALPAAALEQKLQRLVAVAATF